MSLSLGSSTKSPTNTGWEMETTIWAGLILVGALNVLACLVRVALGPSTRDRLTGALFAGTTGAAILITASVAADAPALRDVALALVALAAVVVVAHAAARSRRGAD